MHTWHLSVQWGDEEKNEYDFKNLFNDKKKFSDFKRKHEKDIKEINNIWLEPRILCNLERFKEFLEHKFLKKSDLKLIIL